MHRLSVYLRIFVVLPLTLALTSASALAASTAANQNITLTPSSTSLAINPGATAKGSFEVINNGKSSFMVAASAAPYRVKGVTYDPQFTALPGTTDASQWVHILGNATQEVKPFTLTTFNYTVTVPTNTTAGGYYAVLFATSTPTPTSSNGVIVHNRVGDILYLTVNGPVHKQGFIANKAIHSVIVGTGSSLGLLVGNRGGVHFLTTSHITVTNMFGKTVYNYSAQRIVLPSTQRLITTTWTTKAPVGIYHIDRSTTLPSGTGTLPTKTVVLIQPWLAVVGGLLIVLLLVWIARKVGRRRRN